MRFKFLRGSYGFIVCSDKDTDGNCYLIFLNELFYDNVSLSEYILACFCTGEECIVM